MSSVMKCVGVMTVAGAAVSGAGSLYRGMKVRKKVIADAERVSKAHGGKIPTGGMTKDGKLWDGETTVAKIKKDTAKGVAMGTVLSALSGAVSTAIISGLTLLAKAKIK